MLRQRDDVHVALDDKHVAALAYGRAPSDVEQRASAAFVREANTAKTPDRLNAWEQFAQAILASNEFLWVD